MRLDEIDQQPCPVARSIAEIGDAWSMLILREAFYGRRRFSEFVERTGAQKTVISSRLKQLVAAGILERTLYSEHPPRAEYRLTEKGRDLAPVLYTLAKWGETWLDGADGRRIELRHTCGHHVGATVVCDTCGESVRPQDITPATGPGFPAELPDPFEGPYPPHGTRSQGTESQ